MRLFASSFIEPFQEKSRLKQKGYTIWTSSAIKGYDGKYHMFVAQWLNGYSLSTWITNTTIVYVVSGNQEALILIWVKHFLS